MINKAALDLIKEFEGFRANAYKDPIGIWTIGYGTTAAAGVGIAPRAGMKITEAQATQYLNAAVSKFADEIRPKITHPINENQFGAFVSLAYNIGPGAFARSTALRKFNAGDVLGAADAILLFNKAGGQVMKGLQRRRAAERALFIEGNSPDIRRKPPALQKPMQPSAPAKPGWLAAIIALIKALLGMLK